MPFIRVRDSRGMEYSLRSQQPELIAAWFLETLAKLDIGSASWNQIFIEPDWVVNGKGENVPDWPTHHMPWIQVPNGLTPVDRGRWLVERMQQYFKTLRADGEQQLSIPEF